MPIKQGVMYELAKDGRVMLEMQDVMDMVADVKRLEWLIDQGAHVCLIISKWSVWYDEESPASTPGFDNWRDAIDEAMKNE